MATKAGTVWIYALCHPDTGEVRYIGKANNPASRLKQHLRETRRATPVYSWIGKLRSEGKTPSMQVMAAAFGDWQECEKALIAQHREGGRLLNLALGGDEPFCPTGVRADNGRANAKLRVSTPLKQKIYKLKQALGVALKHGYVSEETKAKLRLAAIRKPALFGSWANI